jgi:hypothetical protein
MTVKTARTQDKSVGDDEGETDQYDQYQFF